MEALDPLTCGGGCQRTAAFPGDILQGSRAANAAICELGLPGDPSEPADIQVRCSALWKRATQSPLLMPNLPCCLHQMHLVLHQMHLVLLLQVVSSGAAGADTQEAAVLVLPIAQPVL